ncbi:cytochrome c oxidase assembly protein [Rhodovibrionaceae bacterium A322]
MSDDKLQDTSNRKNTRMAVVLFSVVCGMVGLAFASVPLYQLFCQVTGFGGTTQVAEALPEEISDRVIKVRFNADTNARLPWDFKAKQREIQTRIGEPQLAFFQAKNVAERPTVGTAVFNVTPDRAGQYFNKVQCFCFDEQLLAPGQEIDMGVSYFIDPAILEDPALDNVSTITLSYTFFRDLDDWDAEQAEQDTQTSGVSQDQNAARLAQAPTPSQ